MAVGWTLLFMCLSNCRPSCLDTSCVVTGSSFVCRCPFVLENDGSRVYLAVLGGAGVSVSLRTSGTVGRNPGSQSEADCEPCEPGVTCQVQNGVLVQQPCPAGHYCPAGSVQAQRCPESTYRGYTGGGSKEDCFVCPAGYFCSGTGLITPSGACQAGSVSFCLCPSLPFWEPSPQLQSISCRTCPFHCRVVLTRIILVYASICSVDTLIELLCTLFFFAFCASPSPHEITFTPLA